MKDSAIENMTGSDKEQVIVSLTSFPAAMSFTVKSIKSILDGSVLPDKIVLYLIESEIGDKPLPADILELAENNPIFEIRYYDKEIRSYAKLIPALRDFPDAVIVTVDDDIEYDKDMLKDLLSLHSRYPDKILAHRAKRIKINAPYKKWRKYRWYHFLKRRMHASYLNLQTGVGGVLYPAHSLKTEMLDEQLFREMAPTADDIWFWAAAVAQGSQIMPVPFGHNKPKGVGKPREISLKSLNFKSGVDLNAKALKVILEKYPEIKTFVKKEQSER